jgi:hypothetical protein
MKSPMRCPYAYLVSSALLLALLSSVKAADMAPLEIPRDQHVWGKFPKGAWKRVRLRTENVDAQGHITDVTVTESKTALDRVEDTGVTLRIEQSVQIQGKRFDSPVQVVRKGFNGQTIGNCKWIRVQLIVLKGQLNTIHWLPSRYSFKRD